MDLLDRYLVADLDDAKCLVDREPVAGRVVDRLVMRHDLHQVIGVTAVWGKDDTAPELVDPDGADAVVHALLELLQVQAGVGVLRELVDRFLDGGPYGFLELRVIIEEVFVDREARQNWSILMVRMRSSTLFWSFSRCRLA